MCVWSAEEDEEVWPGATDETQRLRMLEQTVPEAPAVAHATPLQTKRRSRRCLPRHPAFWNQGLELIRDYKGKHGRMDVRYRCEVHVGDENS